MSGHTVPWHHRARETDRWKSLSSLVLIQSFWLAWLTSYRATSH